MSAPDDLRNLNDLLDTLWAQNGFYRAKWRRAGVTRRPLETPAQLAEYPFTTRPELVADQNSAPPWGTNLAGASAELKRVHRSAGTTVSTLFCADSTASWRAATDDARELLQIAALGAEDRVFVLLPFGPARVPWLLYEAAIGLGCTAFTVGDADAAIQLAFLRHFRPNVVVTKSSRLAALARAARELGLAVADLGVERVLTTGSLGSTDTALAAWLREQWPAEYHDCYLLAEAGAVAGECPSHPGGMHLLARSVLAEVVHPERGSPVAEGEAGELVLTTLNHPTQPVIRYRTGDLVRMRHHVCPCGRTGPLLVGGVHRRDT